MAFSSLEDRPDLNLELSRERAMLTSYFQYLSQFSFDKAKEIIDREREFNKAQAPLLWSSTLNILNKFASSEKLFYSLAFLSQNFGSRIFSRKDTLKNEYNCSLLELKKMDTAYSSFAGGMTGPLEQLVRPLARHLHHFITARIKTIGFYEQMVLIGVGHNRNANCGDLLSVIMDISAASRVAFEHTILSHLASSFSLECDTITHLLQAQLNIETCQYLSSLLHLHNAHTKLTTWSTYYAVRDVKKLGFGVSNVSKTVPAQALFDWLVRYRSALISKFSLYFYDVLARQAPPQDVKILLSKMSFDFYVKIGQLQKRCDASNVLLLFDAGLAKLESFRGLGYHHPQRYFDSSAAETSNCHIIFSYSQELVKSSISKIFRLYSGKSAELDCTSDKPSFVHQEDGLGCVACFMIRVDQFVTLIAVFETRRVERDTNVISYISSIATELRCNKLFAALRPGSK